MAGQLRHLTHDDWERPRCTICTKGRTGEVDVLRVEKLLADRGRLRAVAAKFSLQYAALRRHWNGISVDRRNFLRAGPLSRAALTAAADEERVATVDHLRIVRAALYKGLEQALEVKDHAAVAALGNSLTRNIMQSAALIGEWVPSPSNVQNNLTIMSMPDAVGVLANLSKILAPFADARKAVVDFLRSSSAPQLPAPKIEVVNDQ